MRRSGLILFLAAMLTDGVAWADPSYSMGRYDIDKSHAVLLKFPADWALTRAPRASVQTGLPLLVNPRKGSDFAGVLVLSVSAKPASLVEYTCRHFAEERRLEALKGAVETHIELNKLDKSDTYIFYFESTDAHWRNPADGYRQQLVGSVCHGDYKADFSLLSNFITPQQQSQALTFLESIAYWEPRPMSRLGSGQ